LDWETVIFSLLLILAVITRFYDLEARVMSHDETSHVYFSWLFTEGRGYSHDPVTHGPLQFHLLALSYFMFGDNDFTARIPAVLFSIATIAFMWNYRKLIGRIGALIAALLLLISPYLLYYGRYVRNEAFVAFFGVVTIWAILRYLEDGAPRYLFWLTAVTALHFTAKETAFIYTAQAMIFLALYLVYRLMKQQWVKPNQRNRFVIALLIGLLLITVGGAISMLPAAPEVPVVSDIPTPETTTPVTGTSSTASTLALPVLAVGVLALIAAAYFAVAGYSWARLKTERSFGALIVLTTLVLPMLSPFPVKILGINPIDYNDPQSRLVTGIFIAGMSLAAILIGLLWNRRLWLINAAIFYAIFIVLYTTVFTNGFGFITGLVGSLGYWLEQQGVNRGSQPWYYYAAVQIPIYEYLPALGVILTIIFGPRLIRASKANNSLTESEAGVQESLIQTKEDEPEVEICPQPETTVSMLVFWSITSLVAYTIAGEKMPWLTVHIAFPMILTTAWFLGQVIDTTDWQSFRRNNGILVVILLPVFFLSLSGTLGSLLGVNPPFQGKELEQLRATSTFITALIVAVASGAALAYLVKNWATPLLVRVLTLGVFTMLGLLTARAAFTASFINYDKANELLVYAHSASGPKIALDQIEEISRRTTDGLALKVAYDNETTYPFWWYLRNFTNQDYFDRTPSRAQRDAPVILVGEGNYGKIEPVVGQAYNQFDYIRIWWPNQDYFDLTWERILDAFLNPEMRAALFKIWLDRDYTLYGQVTNKDMSFPNWYPSNRMRLYIRKDITNSLWNYGVTATTEEVIADPYEGKQVAVTADKIYGTPGVEPGQFQKPRGIAVAPDGSLYIADTNNNRIQHLDVNGNVLHTWGSFADISQGPAPGGTFFEPWGIAVGPDGSVYVADTWNHRIQKFSPEGEFLTMWGYFGQAEAPDALWGPRDIAASADGIVYVSDTGNKRIVLFDSDGNPISEFGEAGLAPGQFDEPVGIAIDNQGQLLFVADTWNQRIQSFIASTDYVYQPLNSWDIVGWYGQSLDNKPYLAVDSQEYIYATDPEGYRVLQFTAQGEFVRFWGDLSSGPDGFGLVGAIAVDAEDGIWVTDPGNHRVMHFVLPPP
jgi:predicted membrane-bound mannosyltransferase/DNA-binding beta-propeller fold protein YncE